jgi:hypothetical protein
MNTYHWYVFYVTFLLSELNGQTRHIDILKIHLVIFFILGRVFYNYRRAKKYLIDVRKGI